MKRLLLDSGVAAEVVQTPPNADDEMQFDLGAEAHHIDGVVLLSDDGNAFAGLLAALGRRGKMVCVVSAKPQGCKSLRSVANEFGEYLCLTDFRSDIEYARRTMVRV